MRSISGFPTEVQLAVIQACLEPIVGMFSEDELAAVGRNRDVLKAAVRVCRLWNVIATPLLYRNVIVRDPKIPTYDPDDGEDDGEAEELWPTQDALARTLRSSPAHAAFVHRLHYERSSWYLAERLLDPSLWATHIPVQPHTFRLTSLSIILPTVSFELSASVRDVWLESWFDFSALSRLEVLDFSEGDGDVLLGRLLNAAVLPNLVDLRLHLHEELWTPTDQLRLKRALQSLGPRLRVLHLLVHCLHNREVDETLPWSNLSLPLLCPSLREFACVKDTFLPGLWPPHIDTVAAWSSLGLDRLVLGIPDQQAGGRSHLTDVFESACNGGDVWIAINIAQSKTVAFAGLDVRKWGPSDRVLGRAIADVVWAAREGAVCEDRFGRVFERSGVRALVTV